MKLAFSPSFTTDVDCHSGRVTDLAIDAMERFENLKANFGVLIDSMQRLQKIQDQHESLLTEIHSVLEMRPGYEQHIAELLANAGCVELNRGCINALEHVTHSLKVEAAALWKSQLQ
jgi:hypothetical protein